jgi:hypothetical protein
LVDSAHPGIVREQLCALVRSSRLLQLNHHPQLLRPGIRRAARLL